MAHQTIHQRSAYASVPRHAGKGVGWANGVRKGMQQCKAGSVATKGMRQVAQPNPR